MSRDGAANFNWHDRAPTRPDKPMSPGMAWADQRVRKAQLGAEPPGHFAPRNNGPLAEDSIRLRVWEQGRTGGQGFDIIKEPLCYQLGVQRHGATTVRILDGAPVAGVVDADNGHAVLNAHVRLVRLTDFVEPRTCQAEDPRQPAKEALLLARCL